MPHAEHARFYVTLTLPFDNHAVPHGVVLNTIDDEDFIRTTWKRQFNADMKIKSIQKLPWDADEAVPIVAELDKANRDAAGDAYRIPRAGEEHLTQKQVDAIRERRRKLEAGEEEDAGTPAPPVPGTTFGSRGQ
jgi:hypothetical protein